MSVQHGTGGPVRRGASGRVRQVAWALVPLLSLGMLAFVPFLRLALARRRRADWQVFRGYLVGDVVAVVLVSATAANSSGATLAGLLLLLLAGFGTAHTLIAFRPGAGEPAVPAASTDANRQAVADAAERMRLRREARRVQQDNPVLAQELKIGRPDLPRGYDDGGLVDVNHVPAAILASHLGLTPAEVTAVITARDKLGRFSSTDELSAYADLPPGRLDGLRDWLLLGLPSRRPAAAMAPPGRAARSIDWSGAFQGRSSRAAGGCAEQGQARRGAAPGGA
jgi:DNA uptake protein ComE-like DNA-binding protein